VTAVIDLEDIRVEYGDLVAVDGLSVSVREGELFCLLGPSGCGKTTTLRTIAGFESPTRGGVRLAGRDVTGLAPYDRDCATVFQSWALFPNKSVIENVAFGQKMAGISKGKRRERAREQLAAVEMAEYADASPAELSGGQKQRVALARALAVDPAVLLLDEPLSNLDKRLRETMQLEIKEIHERLETPMVYVTHDQAEAFTLADRIGVMNNGELVQVGDPETVYDDPVDRFVESFLGSTNFLSGRVVEAGREGADIEFPALGCRMGVPGLDTSLGDDLTASVRPEVAGLAPAESPDGGTVEASEGRVTLAGRVADVVYRGSNLRYRVAVGPESGGRDLFVERSVTRAPDLSAGDRARVSWSAGDLYYFGPDGARVRL